MAIEQLTLLANSTEFTVSELSLALKRTLEERFGVVRVRGEISGYRGPHGSGHAYFSLKDDAAKLDAIVWRTTFAKLKFKPQEGLEVVAVGRITTFSGKSAYQIVIESIEPAGAGALMALLEARRTALRAEGLFDDTRKRPLPSMPRIVGVVTSPTGAVIHDILHRISDRFPLRVVLWPVRVQGDGAADEIAAAIQGLNTLPAGGVIPRPDIIVVARGGGSLEDLWCFNEEVVVRAAAASAVPLISAVGHESDWTLIDLVSDLRAPTPTAAIELGVPVRAELMRKVDRAGDRLFAAMARLARERGAQFRSTARVLPAPKAFVSQVEQYVDALDDRMRAARDARLASVRLVTTRLGGRLARLAPVLRAARLGERARELGRRLDVARRAWIGQERGRLERPLSALLPALRRTLERRADGCSGLSRRWILRLTETEKTALRASQAIEQATTRLSDATRRSVVAKRTAAGAISQVFAAVNHRAVLQRGYAMVVDKNGAVLKGVGPAMAARTFTVQFADGGVGVTAETE